MTRAMICAGVLALGVVACGSGDKGGGASAEPSSSAKPAKTTESAKPASSAPPAANPAPPVQSGAKIDQSTPEKVFEGIIAAAKASDPAGLAALCDEKVKADRDAKQICGLTKEDKHFQEFVEFAGSAKVTNTKVDGDKAAVDFSYGKDGSKKETLKMAKVDGKWFLESM